MSSQKDVTVTCDPVDRVDLITSVGTFSIQDTKDSATQLKAIMDKLQSLSPRRNRDDHRAAAESLLELATHSLPRELWRIRIGVPGVIYNRRVAEFEFSRTITESEAKAKAISAYLDHLERARALLTDRLEQELEQQRADEKPRRVANSG